MTIVLNLARETNAIIEFKLKTIWIVNGNSSACFKY